MASAIHSTSETSTGTRTSTQIRPLRRLASVRISATTTSSMLNSFPLFLQTLDRDRNRRPEFLSIYADAQFFQ